MIQIIVTQNGVLKTLHYYGNYSIGDIVDNLLTTPGVVDPVEEEKKRKANEAKPKKKVTKKKK